MTHAVESWEWFGRPAHFICAQWCRFHMATLVGPWVVSTVGAYVHPRHGKGNERSESEWLAENYPGEEIGHGRKFETMVFRADGSRCDAEGCGCELPGIDGHELDCNGYMTDGEATRGHTAMCRKWAERPADWKDDDDD